MRVRLFAALIVTVMIASTLLPAVAAENSTTGESEGRQLQAEPPDCPDWAGLDAWTAAAEAELAADIAKEGVARDEVFGAIAAGEGVVSTVSASPFYLPLVILWQAARETLLGIEVSKEYYLHCENEAHWELLQEVDTKIDELTAVTETDDTENNRIEIENALYPCTPLVGFYLPIANGGQIETVQEVVQEAITGSQDAGFNVYQAQQTYNNAVTMVGQGAYRDAFITFCSAYGQLIASSSASNSSQVPRTYGSGYIYLCMNYYTGQISQSRNYSARPPAVDPSTLCRSNERPMEVLGWTFG